MDEGKKSDPEEGVTCVKAAKHESTGSIPRTTRRLTGGKSVRKVARCEAGQNEFGGVGAPKDSKERSKSNMEIDYCEMRGGEKQKDSLESY